MHFSTASALIALPVMVLASPASTIPSHAKRDQKWSFNVYLHKNESCSTTPTVVEASGSMQCGGFGIDYAGTWSKNELADGCTVNFYAEDNYCGTKLDWMDKETPEGQCKTISEGVMQTFDVTCNLSGGE